MTALILKSFLTDCLTVSKGQRVSSPELHSAFVKWADRKGFETAEYENKNKFHKHVHEFLSTHVFNGDYRIQDVTALELEEYLSYLKTEKHNSSKTIYTELTGIQSFYNYMERMGYCKNVPRTLAKISVEQKEREYLTIEEMSRLLQCIERLKIKKQGVANQRYPAKNIISNHLNQVFFYD